MTKIERTTVKGSGHGTVNTNGWPYASFKTDGVLAVEYTVGGVTHSTGYQLERMLIPPGVTTLNVKASGEWEVFLQNSVPNENLSELKVRKDESGGMIFSGDDDIVFRGQDVDPAAVDISEVRINLDTISKLFTKALVRPKSVNDAARYLKAKNEFLKRY